MLKVPDDVMEGQEFDQSVYYVCPDFHSLYISLVVTIYLNDCWKWRLTPISITPYPISLFNVSKMRDTRYMKTQDSLLWQESLNLYSTHINKTNIKHKETMTFDVGNPAPGLGQAQKCGRIKRVNGIPTFHDIIFKILLYICKITNVVEFLRNHSTFFVCRNLIFLQN